MHRLDLQYKLYYIILYYVLYVYVCAYLLFGGQFSYTVRFVESKIDHSLKQGNGLFWVTRLSQEMTLLSEDI